VQADALRFLVIKLADLGDALTATPALRALRATFPRARIDVLVTSIGASALAGLDSVDRIRSFEKAQFDRFQPRLRPIVEALRIGFRLRLERYDRVFLFHHLFTRAGRVKYGVLLTSIGSPWRGGIAEVRPRFLTEIARDRGYGMQNEADYWLDVVGLVGARTVTSPRLEIAIDDVDRARASQLLGKGTERPRSRIALFPGSGAYSQGRRWSEAGYAAVGRGLATDNGADILVVGTSGEKALGDRICGTIGSAATNLAGKTDLKTLAAVLESCDLVIGNDGGVTHVAMAAGAPVIAIFGPTNHVSWGPYRGPQIDLAGPSPPRVVVVRHELPCSPCHYRGFLPGTPRGCRSHDCLTLIEPHQVIIAARQLLAARPSPADRVNE
jgi:ADP-heptose:LPS heptosyltransferase